jgi:hypothetical protein
MDANLGKRDVFLKKIVEVFRLPNQTGVNVQSSFEGDQIGIPAFCAFLTQFQLNVTLIRKAGHMSIIQDLTELPNVEGNAKKFD